MRKEKVIYPTAPVPVVMMRTSILESELKSSRVRCLCGVDWDPSRRR